jgi:RNA polymerase sigma-70 factor, ECF subfamily
MIQSDTELINKAKSGDVNAFEELVYRYDRLVLSLAVKYVRDNDTAKDIYQEVFIKAFKGIKNFKFQSEFSTWLFRITTNVCLTHNYKIKKQQYMAVSIDDAEESGKNIQNNYGENSPETYTDSIELTSSISNALEYLSPQQKMIFVLKHYEGYKLREISVMMDLKEGTVKKYLFEAVRKLREKLKHFYE